MVAVGTHTFSQSKWSFIVYFLTDLAEEYLLSERKKKDFYDSTHIIKMDFLKWLFKKYVEEQENE